MSTLLRCRPLPIYSPPFSLCSDLNLEFEIPFRELGFFGVPARATSFIMPTVNCLVELTEMPFTVITLSEVNLVNLERVGFNLRNFDMVFIWKDLNRDVGRIDTIPQQSLETIKDWLTSIEIKYYESKVNLNWKNIFKSIKEVRSYADDTNVLCDQRLPILRCFLSGP